MKDLVIIGAGPAGLTAAITAAKRGKKVTIIERNNKCGKKLLITGSGKCNYFNEDQNINHYHTSSKENLDILINKKNIDKALNFFDTLGIIPNIKNGYYYPSTNEAVTIYNALIYEAKKLNIEIIYDTKITEIIKKDSFILNPSKEKIKAKKIIIASGSKAMPKTGSDGSGYNLAKSLNHTIIEPKPGLVGLKGNETYFKKWSGIRSDVIITHYEDEKLIRKEQGNIQLTDYGISGIVTFNISSHIARNINNHKEIVKINFIPWVKQSAYTWLKTQAEKTKCPIKETLERFINYKLADIIIKKTNIKTNSFSKLKEKEFKNLVYNLTNFEIEIKNVNSFEKAQVCSGGISLNEINLKTLESKIIKNLFFAGEIIDINGDCGGYNLTNAWITGIIAGQSI